MALHQTDLLTINREFSFNPYDRISFHYRLQQPSFAHLGFSIFLPDYMVASLILFPPYYVYKNKSDSKYRDLYKGCYRWCWLEALTLSRYYNSYNQQELQKYKDILGAFWDKLDDDKAKEIMSFKDVNLEDDNRKTLLALSSLEKEDRWNMTCRSTGVGFDEGSTSSRKKVLTMESKIKSKKTLARTIRNII